MIIMHTLYLAEVGSILDSLTPTVVLVGILVVILSVLIVFWLFRSIFTSSKRLLAGKTSGKKGDAAGETQSTEETTAGEISAAIAMALYQHFGELHDKESGVVTIKRFSKPYSPWSSKLYNMRNPKIR